LIILEIQKLLIFGEPAAIQKPDSLFYDFYYIFDPNP
jgi:hypothetical protein